MNIQFNMYLEMHSRHNYKESILKCQSFKLFCLFIKDLYSYLFILQFTKWSTIIKTKTWKAYGPHSFG